MEGRTERLLSDISRLIDEVVSLDELRSLLNSGKKLTIKYGVDCTAPFLHLGHAVNLWTMRRFQEDGHKVVFLIGNFTSKIGDPTGKNEARKMLSDEEIEESAQEFIRQVGHVLITDDPEVFEIRRNAEWYEKMSLAEFIGLCSLVTHSKMISREMFRRRIENDADIYMSELLYPILQGYDSVMLESDLTVVGTDQLFNEMMGRFFQEKFGQTKQIVMTTKITKGLWGDEKQSKSIGNFVALNENSKDMFGKIMTLNDDRIIDWLKVYSDIALDDIEAIEERLKDGENPRDIKMLLAHAITRRYHGKAVADGEQKAFTDTFSKGIFPDDAPTIQLSVIDNTSAIGLVKASGLKMSNNQVRTLVSQGAITLNGSKLSDPYVQLSLTKGDKLKIGKRNFFKLA